MILHIKLQKYFLQFKAEKKRIEELNMNANTTWHDKFEQNEDVEQAESISIYTDVKWQNTVIRV